MNYIELQLLFVWLVALNVATLNAIPSPGIICGSDLEQADPYNYDCSGLSLEWPQLNNLIDATWSATNLNLAFNSFTHTIANMSFNRFKLLNNTLNLSSNSLDSIESHAFYYTVQLNVKSNETGTLVSFPIVKLDLSNNSFGQLPWNSIKSLSNLKELFLSHNQISSLDMGDLMIGGGVDSANNNLNDYLFSSLTHVYLSSCGLKYVSAEILKYLTNLLVLDLSNNQLKSMDAQIGQVLGYNNDQRYIDEENRRVTQLDFHNNPLQCNCSLLWLKKYLLKYGKSDNQQMCIATKQTVQQPYPSIVKTETIDLSLDQASTVELNQETMFLAEEEKNETIVWLDESRFVCDLEFIDTANATVVKKVENKYVVQLTCVVKGFPKPVIRWNQGQKALDKNIDQNFFIVDNQTSVLNNRFDADYVTDMYIVTSRLELKKSFIKIDQLNEYKNYSCTAKFDQPSGESNLLQKMVLFKIYRTETEAQQQGPVNSPIKTIDPSLEVKELNKDFLSRRSETYWLVLLFCILVALIFILFASICIIRNVVQSYQLEKKIIEKEKVFNGNRASTYSYTHSGTLGRRTNETYSGSTTSTTRNSAMGLLKPDVIRPHHDHASNYNTSSNRTPSTRQSSPNSNINSFLYSSPASLPPRDDPAELDKLININQSYDNNRVDMSLLFDDDEASSSSKSFDENIEQYQEPQFDDLRKPVPKITK